jgi:hypothetical protein
MIAKRDALVASRSKLKKQRKQLRIMLSVIGRLPDGMAQQTLAEGVADGTITEAERGELQETLDDQGAVLKQVKGALATTSKMIRELDESMIDASDIARRLDERRESATKMTHISEGAREVVDEMITDLEADARDTFDRSEATISRAETVGTEAEAALDRGGREPEQVG